MLSALPFSERTIIGKKPKKERKKCKKGLDKPGLMW
jgi:hypothetical protein